MKFDYRSNWGSEDGHPIFVLKLTTDDANKQKLFQNFEFNVMRVVVKDYVIAVKYNFYEEVEKAEEKLQEFKEAISEGKFEINLRVADRYGNVKEKMLFTNVSLLSLNETDFKEIEMLVPSLEIPNVNKETHPKEDKLPHFRNMYTSSQLMKSKELSIVFKKFNHPTNLY